MNFWRQTVHVRSLGAQYVVTGAVQKFKQGGKQLRSLLPVPSSLFRPVDAPRYFNVTWAVWLYSIYACYD